MRKLKKPTEILVSSAYPPVGAPRGKQETIPKTKNRVICIAPRKARDFAKQSKIIVVVGPTASGKSALAIFLARKLNGEIISADSRQVYRGMDIGTGKVTRKERRLVQHHLIDVVSPKKEFDVSEFKSRAERAIADILYRGKLPIICGGTGFYVDALVYDLDLPEVPSNKKLRIKLDKLTAEELFKKLKKLDSHRAKTIDRHNKVRLIRALEIVDSIGAVPILDTRYQLRNPQYDVLWLGLNPKDLDKRIAKRLNSRLKQGMVREIQKLHDRGVSWKRLRDLGLEYRWISKYLTQNSKRKAKNYNSKFKGSEHYQKLLSEIKKYSKRQMTWFKRNKNIHWIKNSSEATPLVSLFARNRQSSL